MKRELISYLMSIMAITGSMFGCTVYDDDGTDLTTVKDPTNGRNESPTVGEKTLQLGGAKCADNSECGSGVCYNGVCGCTEEDSCISGMYCNTTSNLCKHKKLNGDACSSNKECSSGLCDNGTCGGCNTSSDCQENNVCVNNSCEAIVACPGNEYKAKKCFKTMHITPTAGWLGSGLNESSIADGDSLGSILTPVLPNIHDDDVQFCIRPIMGMLTTDFKTTTSQGIKTVVNNIEFTAYLQNLIKDNMGEENYAAWSKLISEDENNLPLSELFGDTYEEFVAGVDRLMSDPRITQRLNKGCVILPVQREETASSVSPAPFNYRLLDPDSKWAGHSIYMKGFVKNSGLMTEATRFTLSLEAKPETSSYDEQSISYKSAVSFPIGFSQTMTMSNYDTETVKTLIARFDGNKLTGNDYKFYFKINDISATESTFACNEYDISSGICPGTVERADNGYLSISSKCSKNDNYTSISTSCVPQASFVLDHIEIYVELGEDD